jgi:hypothetical protein
MNATSMTRILVQHSGNRLFLTEEDEWSPCFEAARTFKNTSEAVLHCSRRHIDQAHVLMTFGEKQYDCVLRFQSR